MKKKLIITVLAAIVVIGLGLRLGLPSFLRTMGLHSEYQGQRYMIPEGKALIICTSHDRLGEDGGHHCGDGRCGGGDAVVD